MSISKLGAFSSKLVSAMPSRNCCIRDGLLLEPFAEWSRIPSSATINYRWKYLGEMSERTSQCCWYLWALVPSEFWELYPESLENGTGQSDHLVQVKFCSELGG